MADLSTVEIESLVQPDRVHRRVYTDPDVFALEMERIFAKTWLFVGHASQIPSPGDWFLARAGNRQIIISRHADGVIYAFHNRCAHRGMPVCLERKGNARRFLCPYHGWAFDTDGSLAGVPLEGGYHGKINKGDAAFSLRPVGRVDDYRGFIFASLATDGPGLKAHLGRMTAAIDNMVDRAPEGEIELAGGGFRIEYPGNWKLHMENANDLVHASVTHESSASTAAEFTKNLPPGTPEDHAFQMFKGNGLPLPEMEKVEIHGLDGGHSFMGGFYKSGTITQKAADPVLEDYRQRMRAAYGDNRAEEIIGWDTFNHLIYPNLILNPKHAQFRLILPLAADRTEVRTGCFRLKGAPEEMFHVAVKFLGALTSPASLITSDDNAMFVNAHRAIAREDEAWIDLKRGLGTDLEDPEGGLVGEVGTSELPLRTQYAAWKRFMTG